MTRITEKTNWRLAFFGPVSVSLMASLMMAAPSSGHESKGTEERIRSAVSELLIGEITELKDERLTRAFKCTFVEAHYAWGNNPSQLSLPGYQKHICAWDGRSAFLLKNLATNQKLDRLARQVRPELRMHKGMDAKLLLEALERLYPMSEGEKSEVAELGQKVRRHGANSWLFVRGKFFRKLKGFIVTTDEDGRVMNLEYALNIEPS